MGKKKHGMYASPEYNIWAGMKGRCLNSSNKDYKKYGLRGISVDASWIESFDAFYADMGPRPPPMEVNGKLLQYSIDRKDNSKGYYKENCRWALPTDQCNNRRSNRMVEYKGMFLTVTELARIAGVEVGTLFKRLRMGYTPEEAAINNTSYWVEHHRLKDGPIVPVTGSAAISGGYRKQYTLNGRTQTLSAWAKELGADPSTLNFRLRKGWSLEQALSVPPKARYRRRG